MEHGVATSGLAGLPLPPPPSCTAVLIVAHARPTYLAQCLVSVLRHRPAGADAGTWHPFPLFISQDGDHAGVAIVATAHCSRAPDSVFALRQPHATLHGRAPAARRRELWPYYYVSAHYRRALGHLFDDLGFESVIALEEDMEIAPDFFGYFAALAPLLRADPSLLAVSAWNDHGRPELACEPEAVYRTDVFPGLGWMSTRERWEELRPGWPDAFWDDWLRDPAVHRGRSCLRPEVSRARTFGRIGVSGGQFFGEHLRHVALNDRPVDFAALDFGWIVSREQYEAAFARLVASARGVDAAALADFDSGSDERPTWPPLEPRATDLRVVYDGKEDYAAIATMLGMQPDMKSGAPRASYRGVATVQRRDRRIFIAPRDSGRHR